MGTEVVQGYRSTTAVQEKYSGIGYRGRGIFQFCRGTEVEEFFSLAGVQEYYSDTIGPGVV
jgi:hypothetical protein